MIVTDHTCLLDCGWGCVNETGDKVTSKFKAGDRVRLTGSWWPDFDQKIGSVVVIEGAHATLGPYFSDDVGPIYIREAKGHDYGAELVTDHQDEYVPPDLSALAGGMTDVESAAIGLSKLADVREEGAEVFNFQKSVEAVTSAIASMLIAKNKAYGNSALDPIRTFSKANAREQLLVRIDDKLSRIARGNDFPNEDTIDDLIGYLVLLKIAGSGESDD